MRIRIAILVVLVTSCAQPRRPKMGTLDSERECIYSFLSSGRLAVADEILGDTWDIGPRAVPIHLPTITWTEDPYSDSYWRFIFYSLRPTANLLWAYYATGDAAYRDKLIAVLRSYAAYDLARPVDLVRMTFDNRHTTAFRAMVLVNSYFKLKRSGDLPTDLETQLGLVIHKLGAFMADRSNYEPGQNHGFNEAASLMLVAVNFPEFAESSDWQRLATVRLDGLLSDTIDTDGVEVENSPFYHFYVLSFMWQIDSWARRFTVQLPDQFTARTAAMVRYGTYITQPDGYAPVLGSSVAFDLRKNTDSAIYQTIAAADREFSYVLSAGKSGTAPTERATLFPVSGQSVLRSGFAKPFAEQTHVAFNVGKQRTNHSHADALAITYFANNKSLLQDGGVFSYDDGPGHAYFFGTRAHNTIVVDNLDQPAGDQVRAGLTTSGPGWAYQSGAQELHAGVAVKRSVVLLGRDLLLVVDSVTAADPHMASQTWHVFPGARPDVNGLDVAVADNFGVQLAIHQVVPGATLVPIIGVEDPMQGWHSEQYNDKQPSHALEYRVQGNEAHFVTVIASGAYASMPVRASAQLDNDRTHAVICVGTAAFVVDISAPVAPAETVQISAPSACPSL